MNERIKNIFESVNHWLAFAEAKNAMLVIVDITLIISIGGIIIDGSLAQWAIYIAFTSEFFLLVSSMLVLLSFLPYEKANLPLQKNKGSIDESKLNLLFYGDIAKIADECSYIRLLNERYGISAKETDIVECDYAKEIIVNSRITIRKNKMFRYAIYCTIAALGTPILPIIILLFNEIRRKI